MLPPSNRLPSDDRAYHLRRLEQERARAAAAIDLGVRNIHLQLAQAYAARVGARAPVAASISVAE